MSTLKVSSQTPVCDLSISNNVIGQMLQCQQHLFQAFCVTANIPDDRSQRVFLAQMTSCAVLYDVIYHLFPINSQYL